VRESSSSLCYSWLPDGLARALSFVATKSSLCPSPRASFCSSRELSREVGAPLRSPDGQPRRRLGPVCELWAPPLSESCQRSSFSPLSSW